jgi:hypothetical protein
MLTSSLSGCDYEQGHHDTLDEVKQEVHGLKNQLENTENQQRHVISSRNPKLQQVKSKRTKTGFTFTG